MKQIYNIHNDDEYCIKYNNFIEENNSISCVYLLSLNNVKELRDTFNISENIPDDSIVCKYGKTNNLQRRIKEHRNNYGKLKNVKLTVICHSYVDKRLITEAKNQMKNYFALNNMKFNYKNSNEIVIINKEYIENIKQTYKFEFSKFSGSMTKIIQKIIQMEHKFEINKIKYENEIDKLKTKYENEIEIMKLKEEIYNLKK